MTLTLLGTLTIAVLCAPLFSVLLGVSLELALSISALLSLGATIGVSIPDIPAQVALEVDIAEGVSVSAELGVPSVTVQYSASLSAQLALVEGFLAAVRALLAVDGPSVQALAYQGPGSGLGAAIGTALPSSASTYALVFAATSSGSVPDGEIASVQVLGGGQSYEAGLCSVTFPPSPTGARATGTPILTAAGALSGVTITSRGAGYAAPPRVTVSDATAVLGATNTNPVVVEVASTIGVGAVTIAGVTGNVAANGQWLATVIDPTHFSIPVAGSGAYAGGGTVTGAGVGAAATTILGGGAVAQLGAFFDALTFAPGMTSTTLSLGSLCPTLFGLLVELQENLEAQAAALASASLNFGVVPPTIALNAPVVASIGASLEANIDVPPPSIQASLEANASGQAAIAAQLMDGIGAMIGASTEKLVCCSYEGPANGLGAELGATLATGWPDGTPSAATTSVVILSATTPEAQAALNTLFAAAA